MRRGGPRLGRVSPSVDIEWLLAVGRGETPRASLPKLARLGARFIERAVDGESDASWPHG
jgi:hypothetical protein